MLTGSQKALSIPPGLAFFTVSERAVAQAETVEQRGFYTDLLRYRDMHWAATTGFSFLAATHRSPTVSCLLPPADIDPPALVAALGEAGWTIGPGYGKLKPRAIRIGHMGEVGPEHLRELLAAIDATVAGFR